MLRSEKRTQVLTRQSEAPKGESTAAELARIVESFELGDMPGHLFRRLDYRSNQIYQRYTGQNTVTTRQFGILLTLYKHGPMNQSNLGERVHMDRSTLGEILHRMADLALTNRRVAKGDRRAAEISLAPAGRKALLSLVKAARISQEGLIAPLPEEYRPIFVKCLRILADAEIPPADGEAPAAL